VSSFSHHQKKWNKAQAAGLSYLNTQALEATGFGSAETDALEEWQRCLIEFFDMMPRDEAGHITKDQMRMTLVAAGIPKARLARLFRFADVDCSGHLDRHEWVSAVMRDEIRTDMAEFSTGLSKRLTTKGSLDLSAGSGYHPLMVSPESSLRIIWDAMISLLCFYMCVALPFSLAWDKDLTDEDNSGVASNGETGSFHYQFLHTGYFPESSNRIYERAGTDGDGLERNNSALCSHVVCS
jgi:hypothetical protein